MKYDPRLIWMLIKRDFKGCSGEVSLEDFIVQSLLPLLGTIIILMILCSSGILFIGVHQGYKEKLNLINEDPFSTAIAVDGAIKNKDRLYRLAWQKKDNKFIEMDSKNSIDKKNRIIKTITPINSLGMFFVNSDGLFIDGEPLYGNTMPLFDHLTKKAVSDSFVIPGQYFSSDNDQGIIVSQSLYEQLGYSTEEAQPKEIRLLAPNISLPPEKFVQGNPSASPMGYKELVFNTISVPLRGVARSFPDGSFLITEGLFWNLYKGEFYNTNRKINSFFLRPGAIPIKEALEIAQKWITNSNVINTELLKKKPFITKEDGTKVIKLIFKTQEKPRYYRVLIDFEVNKINWINHPILDFGKKPLAYSFGQIKNHTRVLAYLDINQKKDLINNIDKLYHFLNSIEMYVNTHQLETIKRFHSELEIISKMLPFFLSLCGLLIGIYVLVSFALFIQTKRHKIGIMLALGVRSKTIKFAYLIGGSCLLILSFLWALGVALVIENYFMPKEWPFSFSTKDSFFFFILVLCTANISVMAAIYHTLKVMPHRLMSFRD